MTSRILNVYNYTGQPLKLILSDPEKFLATVTVDTIIQPSSTAPTAVSVPLGQGSDSVHGYSVYTFFGNTAFGQTFMPAVVPEYIYVGYMDGSDKKLVDSAGASVDVPTVFADNELLYLGKYPSWYVDAATGLITGEAPNAASCMTTRFIILLVLIIIIGAIIAMIVYKKYRP